MRDALLQAAARQGRLQAAARATGARLASAVAAEREAVSARLAGVKGGDAYQELVRQRGVLDAAAVVVR